MSVQGVYIWIWTLHHENLGLSVNFIWNWQGISDSLSRNCIWKFELTSHLGHFIWQVLGGISESEHFIWKFGSQCALHLKLRGVYLTAHLGTASENLNSHLILVTSSDNFWGGKFWNYHFDHYMSVANWGCSVVNNRWHWQYWNCHSWPLHVSRNVKLPFLTTTCQ